MHQNVVHEQSLVKMLTTTALKDDIQKSKLGY